MSDSYMGAGEMQVLRDAFTRTVARICPAQLALAERTLARVPPTRWQLEWFLPCWLGETFGLDAAATRQFGLSNLLGLVAIRLKDDIADGEVPATELERVKELGDQLEAAALQIYAAHFPAGARFWNRASEYLSEWRVATERVNQLALADFAEMWDSTSDAARCAAHLGAPIKISARAVWELTRGDRAFDLLDGLLDSALSAAVLHDHAVDWDDDLRAGRWNFFVASISPLPQAREFEQENRARVVRAWMETPDAPARASADANTPLVYFNLIESHIERAQRCNRTLGVHGLGQYLDAFRDTVRETRGAMTSYFHEQLMQATARLFGKQLTLDRARTTHEHSRKT